MYLLLNNLNQDLSLNGFVIVIFFSPDCSENPILFRMDCNGKREIAPENNLIAIQSGFVFSMIYFN
jgi:hypothetical protein